MPNPPGPFAFYTEKRLVQLTGLSARSLPELLTHLSEVSGSCIFYHTHYLYLAHHFEKPRFYNDFAKWMAQALGEKRLARQLAAIDQLSMTSVRELREAIIATVRKHLEGRHETPSHCAPGNEFHFCEAKSFMFPTGLLAHNATELLATIGQVTNSCLYFHFFEARLRLKHSSSDFSRWLNHLGETKLARQIDKLNPYAMTLDELKSAIVKLGRHSH